VLVNLPDYEDRIYEGLFIAVPIADYKHPSLLSYNIRTFFSSFRYIQQEDYPGKKMEASNHIYFAEKSFVIV
jgi:hypothetical protein